MTVGAGNCLLRSPCTNIASANAAYTTAGTNAQDCHWVCNAGYRLSGASCVACSAPVGFNASKHGFTAGCSWGCLPGFYRTPTDGPIPPCPPCVDLYPDGSTHGVYARVRQYGTDRAPLWLPNRCGRDGVVVPGAASLFLRNVARYVYAPASGATCGDSLLSAGEQCDDGNAVGGDGCDAGCQLEVSTPPFDCDVIGHPCGAECGWVGGGAALMPGFLQLSPELSHQ